MRAGPQDALIIVDLQNDFLPSGRLPVANGDRIIPVVNRLAALPFQAVVATQDWHPQDHCSFPAQNGPWPVHCVQGTEGAELAALLRPEPLTAIFRKGMTQDVDSYSAFADNAGQNPTGLKGFLQERGITRIFVCGLAYDVCVSHTARDGMALGFETCVVADASASAVTPPDDVTTKLRAEGVQVVRAEMLMG